MAKALTTHELRKLYTDFFIQRGHKSVPSSPLVPLDDPTLLFTSAGMVQFKPLFAAKGKLEYTRATTVQKCFRATDLEQVGHTPRHLTFFEMLGNFSFGDYFKEEAITWAWEFVTGVLEMDPADLWVTVYLDDDEASDLWQKKAGVSLDRIVRLGKKDNFWGPAGSTGACGPSSEIYKDLGEALGCGKPECKPGCDCDRFQEFWNLVFPQFDMDEAGNLNPLPKPGIDTGMGLERLAQLLQGVGSVFEIDEFIPLREAVMDLVDVDAANPEHRIALNIITEHARSVTMLFHEGVYPSNEGRGYVARRILRRAARRGLALGLTEPFLHRLTGTVIDVMRRQYPDLDASRERIAKVCLAEEGRFLETLEQGMRRFDDVVAKTRSAGRTEIAGADVFTLYDTYGFPVDLTDEMAKERGMTADLAGFEAAMEKQVERSRATARFDNAAEDETPWEWLAGEGASNSRFVGYDTLDTECTVVARRPVDGTWELLLEPTPFYAEGGGQVGDRGRLLQGDTPVFEITDVVRREDRHVHRGKPVGNAIPEGKLRARVDDAARRSTERNHTATHLLHAALKRVVGSHVTQAGSLVAPDRLRFDFNHFAPLTPAQIRAIEDDVNNAVLGDYPVQKEITTMDEARAAGAVAMFGEKYGDTVRQVFVPGPGGGDITRELCGGCHLRRTGEVGSFRIVSEESVASGIRRVEAVTGWNAIQHQRSESDLAGRIGALVRAGSLRDVEARLASMLEENDRLKRELQRARDAVLAQSSGDILDTVETVHGVPFLAAEFPVDDAKALRDAADKIRDRMKRGVGLLAARAGGKAALLVFVTDDIAKETGIRADAFVREVAKVVDGGGGGRPDLATAGGKNPERIPEALAAGKGILETLLAASK